MDILHVATELAPFAKVGGLADVVAAITKHLKIQGHKVSLVLPRYLSLEQGGLLLARRLSPLCFVHAGKAREVTLYD
ncbi:MAG: glycogen/starch synthase, partial [Myxococcales bacterium]|nr:glycogen/starch synthase [Polyangiaceae bacterium]MDW8252002.1 glycogen/starch synthase [Myxococcales bacterium]